MSKHIDPRVDGFTINDLISEEGVTLEIGEDYNNLDDEEYNYSPSVHFSNEEILDMLNMNNFDDDNEEKEGVSLCGLSFTKLKEKMTSLTADQKIMKLVKKKGVGEKVPYNGQVTIHYIGYFEDRDEPFDSTYSYGKPRSLRLDQGCIIPGLEIGICSMQKHEIAVFLIHPDLAYGAIGCLPRIPPNEEVVFVVHLINFLDNGSADTYQNLTTEEKQSFPHMIESVKHMLVNAKDYFIKGNTKQAVRKYKKIIDCLENVRLKDDEEEKEMNELLSRAYTNLGVCYNKLDIPRLACLVCNKVPINTAKSYYNFGKALLNLAEYSEAMKKLQNAYKLEPHNHAIIKAIQLTNVKQSQYLKIEKRLWENCLQSKNNKREVTEFRKAAFDLCKSVIDNNDIIRQPLPEGLTSEEHQIVKEEAAALGLDIVTHVRYGKEMIYLQKNKA